MVNNIGQNNNLGAIQKSTSPIVAAERISTSPVAQAAFAELKELFKGVANLENKNGLGKQLYAKDTDIELKPEQIVIATNGAAANGHLADA